MKIQTHPAAGGIVAALWYLLAIVLALQLACVSGRAGFVRQQSKQMDYAVTVRSECGTGSGVMIGGRYVLTANHVVDCKAGKVTVVGVTGTREATVEKRWLDRDVARLRMSGPSEDFWGVNRAVIGQLADLDAVCTAVKYPAAGSACGWITQRYAIECLDGPWCRDTTFNAEVTYGNSGSGLYNARGHLVAIGTGAAFLPGTSHWIDQSFASSLWSIRGALLDD